jgi:hypothetical protein
VSAAWVPPTVDEDAEEPRRAPAGVKSWCWTASVSTRGSGMTMCWLRMSGEESGDIRESGAQQRIKCVNAHKFPRAECPLPRHEAQSEIT